MVSIGPGIVMLFIGLILGASGAAFDVIQRLVGFRLHIAFAGVVVAGVATLAATVLFSMSYHQMQEVVYVLVVNLIPSYLILALVNKLTPRPAKVR